MLFVTQLATSSLLDWPSLDQQGLSLDTTVGELMARKEDLDGAQRLECLTI